MFPNAYKYSSFRKFFAKFSRSFLGITRHNVFAGQFYETMNFAITLQNKKTGEFDFLFNKRGEPKLNLTAREWIFFIKVSWGGFNEGKLIERIIPYVIDLKKAHGIEDNYIVYLKKYDTPALSHKTGVSKSIDEIKWSVFGVIDNNEFRRVSLSSAKTNIIK